jgi:L-malate glycosyltransferase
MRLLVLMPVASPWAREIAMQLQRLGAEVHSVDFASDAPNIYISKQDGFQKDDLRELRESISGLHLLASPTSGLSRHFFGVPALRRLITRVRPDRLLTLYGGGFAMLAWLSGFRPYVVYVMGSDVLLLDGFRARLARRALSSAALVVSNGRYLAERTRHLAPSADVLPLYVGVNTNELVPGVHSADPRIICTRGFLPVYNNEYLVQGLSALGDAAPQNLEVVFAAPGPDLPLVEKLADRILSPTLRSRVRFLNGLGRHALIQELARSQVYVSLSRSDGASFSLMEALACGVFPVLSDLPQNREWVTPEEQNGILVPFEEPATLAAALQRALGDAAWRERAAKYNRQKILEHADVSGNLSELLRLLAIVPKERVGRTRLVSRTGATLTP